MILDPKDNVCVAFAIDGISVNLVGVYDSREVAERRIAELEDLGLLYNCEYAFREEILWEEVAE